MSSLDIGHIWYSAPLYSASIYTYISIQCTARNRQIQTTLFNLSTVITGLDYYACPLSSQLYYPVRTREHNSPKLKHDRLLEVSNSSSCCKTSSRGAKFQPPKIYSLLLKTSAEWRLRGCGDIPLNSGFIQTILSSPMKATTMACLLRKLFQQCGAVLNDAAANSTYI